MILYNVTIGIDREIELAWLEWMRYEHIPNILATGFFTHYELYKVLSHEDSNTVSYCIQYYVPDIKQFNAYLKDYEPQFVEQHREKFAGKHVAFRTLLEKVEQVDN